MHHISDNAKPSGELTLQWLLAPGEFSCFVAGVKCITARRQYMEMKNGSCHFERVFFQMMFLLRWDPVFYQSNSFLFSDLREHGALNSFTRLYFKYHPIHSL